MASGACETGVRRTGMAFRACETGVRRTGMAFRACETGVRRTGMALRQMWHHPQTKRVQEVQVSVEDSGEGFNWKTWLEGQRSGTRPSGRGLSLIQALTRDLTFNASGSRVSFRFTCG